MTQLINIRFSARLIKTLKAVAANDIDWHENMSDQLAAHKRLNFKSFYDSMYGSYI